MLCVCELCITHSSQAVAPTIYVLPGTPTPLARPRFGKNARVYNSQRTEMLIHGLQIKEQHKGKPLYTGPLHVNATFYMKLPKMPREQQKRMEQHYHTSPCDLDNLIKKILDVCNGVLFEDDRIISSVFAQKVYDYNPRTEFNITELK